ncbi:hypothetical protein, partial [Klebsiella michiganensis]|uniref:hypothetical protein n=1 Tax=Klebsiella michiganensis TaxID=1134687 RepID=UPI001BD3E39C
HYPGMPPVRRAYLRLRTPQSCDPLFNTTRLGPFQLFLRGIPLFFKNIFNIFNWLMCFCHKVYLWVFIFK